MNIDRLSTPLANDRLLPEWVKPGRIWERGGSGSRLKVALF